MIHFFRKICKQLVDDNKPVKYLRYAIGEIILVVIGILIALQINNWNTQRQIKMDNQLYLKKMLADLNQNKLRMNALAYETRYDGLYPSLKGAVDQCDSILQLTYRGLKISDIEFIANAKYGSGGPKLNLQISTYEELVNTGKLYTIGSDSLIQALNNYFKLCESEEAYNNENSDEEAKSFKSMEHGLGIMIQNYQMDRSHFDINDYPWFFDKNSQEYRNIQIGIFNMSGAQKTNLFKMNRIIEKSDELIQIIHRNLKE